MKRTGTTITILAALLIANVSARCGANASGARLAPGVWGGEHLRMEVSEGGARLEFDCGAGEIRQPLVLDGEGRFDLKGTFNAQHGGPVLRDEEEHARPARYGGRARGDTLTLSVTLLEPEEDAGTFTLTRGQDARLMKCR